jgi:hypothetical protein
MTVKTQNRKTLNFTTIHKRISEQGKTISELAPEYSMTEEAFIQEMRSGLGPKVFSSLKKTSVKNEKLREKQKSSAERKRRKSEKTSQTNEEAEFLLEKRMSNLISQKEETEKWISFWDGTLIPLDKNKSESNQRIADFKSEIAELEEKIAQEKETLKTIEENYQNSINKKEELEVKLSEITDEIEHLSQRRIFLVAPGYHGEIPNFGRFISTEEIIGMNVEIKKGDLLINDESLNNMMLCGYYDIREYMRALEFAKLCIAHIVECDQYTILVDDERISKVLETQEIEIK